MPLCRHWLTVKCHVSQSSCQLMVKLVIMWSRWLNVNVVMFVVVECDMLLVYLLNSRWRVWAELLMLLWDRFIWWQQCVTDSSTVSRFRFIHLDSIISPNLITGPPIHCVGGQYCFVLWRLSSYVTLHGWPAGGFTLAGHAITSCCLKSNYSSMVTLHGGPVVLRPVRTTLFTEEIGLH